MSGLEDRDLRPFFQGIAGLYISPPRADVKAKPGESSQISISPQKTMLSAFRADQKPRFWANVGARTLKRGLGFIFLSVLGDAIGFQGVVERAW